MEVGTQVRVTPPFKETFSEVYIIESINSDGVYFLEGIETGFCVDYLEEA